MKSREDEFRGPLFIVGFGRSGTKMLRAILAEHPDICIGDVETNFIPSLSAIWRNFGDLHEAENFERFFDVVREFPYFIYQQERGNLIEPGTWRESIRVMDFAGIVEALIRHDCGTAMGGRRVWGDKSPTYTRHVGLLKQQFPQARFVHIVRDVRDVARSSREAWGVSPLRTAQRWVDSVLEPERQAIGFESDLLQVRYEDLIMNPWEVVRSICTHLGVAYSDELLQLRRPSENLGDAKGLTTILPNNSGKGATYFKIATLEKIERIGCEGLRAFGYPCDPFCSPLRLGRTSMGCLRLVDGLKHLLREIRGRGFREGVNFVWQFFRQNLRSGL